MTYDRQVGELVTDASLSDEGRGVIEGLRCVLGSEGAIYVSAPITGGTRYQRWFASEGKRLSATDDSYLDGLQRAVIEPNSAAAESLANILRQSSRIPVIDPSRFSIEHWGQPQYRRLWSQVVEEFAASVHFAEGWGASIGCALEFIHAAQKGISLFEGAEKPLTVTQGLERIRTAIKDLERARVPHAELDQIAERVSALPSK